MTVEISADGETVRVALEGDDRMTFPEAVRRVMAYGLPHVSIRALTWKQAAELNPETSE